MAVNGNSLAISWGGFCVVGFLGQQPAAFFVQCATSPKPQAKLPDRGASKCDRPRFVSPNKHYCEKHVFVLPKSKILTPGRSRYAFVVCLRARVALLGSHSFWVNRMPQRKWMQRLRVKQQVG